MTAPLLLKSSKRCQKTSKSSTKFQAGVKQEFGCESLLLGLSLRFQDDGHSCALSKRSILVSLLMWVTAVRTVAEVPGGRAFLPVTFFPQLSVARFHECSDGQEWPSSWGTCSTSIQVELPNTWLFYKAHSCPSLSSSCWHKFTSQSARVVTARNGRPPGTTVLHRNRSSFLAPGFSPERRNSSPPGEPAQTRNRSRTLGLHNPITPFSPTNSPPSTEPRILPIPLLI